MAENATAHDRGRTALVILTAAAAPVALGFESVLRHLILPAEFELFRVEAEPYMTTAAWFMVVISGGVSLFAYLLQPRLAARAVANLRPEAQGLPEHVRRAETGAYLLGASIPQIPAILATLCYMFGAALAPVLVCLGIVTVTVLAQAFRSNS